MKQKIEQIIEGALKALDKNNVLKWQRQVPLMIDVPKDTGFGDYYSNIALLLAKEILRPPGQLAETIVKEILALDRGILFESVSPAGPGFINFKFNSPFVQRSLREILRAQDKFGKTGAGKGKKILIEFVSANPTGPLHIGHGRWAVIGDALREMLEAAGHRVDTEYYVNDVGKQIDLLKQSVLARAQGAAPPEGGYGGAYITDIATELKDKVGDKNLANILVDKMLSDHKRVLAKLQVRFKRWFHESSLYRYKKVDKTLSQLKSKGVTFGENGALWFKSQELGDDKNRVLVREDGTPTYFASDIAYHLDKYKRGYDRMINVWGTDHHGYVARLKAALKALGLDETRLNIIIGQLVSLFRGGSPVRMSKRTGEMITLEEVADEIGQDALRFFFLTLSADSHLDFDLELAKKHTMDNPVYYVQYAHARISSILREAAKAGINIKRVVEGADLGLLAEKSELDIIKKLLSYPDELEEAANALLPHRLINYLRELAALFHNYYHKCRVMTEEKGLTDARIALVFATRIVLRNVLKLFNISAPDEM